MSEALIVFSSGSKDIVAPVKLWDIITLTVLQGPGQMVSLDH